MTELVIVGTGGHAREVLDIIEALNTVRPQYRVLGFLDEDRSRHGDQVRGLPVLGGLEWASGRAAGSLEVALGVGRPGSRAAVRDRLRALAAGSPTLVHPRACLTSHVSLGEGCIVAAGAVVTSSVRLGEHVHLNVGATVSHDCVVGDYSTLAPGAHLAGNVVLGEGCEVGIGAVVIQGVTVGAGAIVGAGSVVIRPVPANTTVVGVPARVIEQR